jgi:hypothetical protein
MEAKEPSKYRIPDGRAVKPLLLSAPLLGVSQCTVPASFILPPAFVESLKKSLSSCHSSLEGTCQPAGHSFPAETVYPLYNAPYMFLKDAESLLYHQ